VTTTAEGLVTAGDDGGGLPELFNAHYRRLLALAVLVTDDRATAEDLVQEAFARLHGRTLDDPDRALAYLRATVLNLSRSRLRRLRTARKHEHPDDRALPSAEDDVVLRDDQRAVLDALRTLSPRQRQALVLRYWGDLNEAEVAAAMGLSNGAVKSHTSRGLAALRRILEPTRGPTSKRSCATRWPPARTPSPTSPPRTPRSCAAASGAVSSGSPARSARSLRRPRSSPP
jgi:RNA polymerase sigma-70 factor (sigma-E family)